MTKQTIATLKGYFNTGDTPTEANFADLIDSAKGSPQVLVIDPNGYGDYTTVSAALTAITDASASKRYTLLVSGAIAETASVTAKDYVDVLGLPGASVTVTLNSAGHGFLFNNLVSTIWRGVILIRAGAPGALANCVRVYGTSTNGVRFERCQIITNATGTNYQNAVGIENTAAPIFDSCLLQSNAPSVNGLGVYLPAGTPSPLFVDCAIYGGPGTASSYAVQSSTTGGKQVFRNCILKGGNLSTCCYFKPLTPAVMVFDGCTAAAGGGAASLYGFYALDGVTGYIEVNNCVIYGGNGGALCHAVVSDYGVQSYNNCHMIPGAQGGHAIHCRVQSGATFNNCTADLPNAPGVDQNAAIFCGGGAASYFNGCATKLSAINGKVAVTGTTTFVPSATYPVQVSSLGLNIGVAGGAGSTVSVGTTNGGTEIVNAYPLTATGFKYPTLGAGALDVLATGATLYITVNAGGGSPSFSVDWTAFISVANINAVWMQDQTKCKFHNCSLVSAGASDAVEMTADVVTANAIRFSSCHIEAKTATAPMKAINAAAAYNPAPVYNCVLIGGTTNITAAAGTANGTNTEI